MHIYLTGNFDIAGVVVVVFFYVNLRFCVEKLLVTQGAQSSDSDASDFTGDEGAAAKLFRLPPGRLHVSRHRYREFKPIGDTASGLQQVDSPARLSVFLPDMSASTLNG